MASRDWSIEVVLGYRLGLGYWNRVWVYKKIAEQGHIEFGGDIVLQTFKFTELEEVTNGFREELGRGASGTVYKETIPYNHKVVAVKKLEKALAEGEREFQREIRARELGKLVGHEEEVDKRKLERMVKVALWCIQDEPSLRPSMKKVLLIMEGTVDIPSPLSPTSFLSAI
ncbi:hypothetical protein Vadar_028285 [Vaccinium darrowii]|uniref:Uncharacterized protein n=1 Tax=Vaccinium darrowii TaxID=229202 RepID=A0ACB7Z795_9ERIC|nr:hypothetical protein Vadar_028285 [Vaccinium darrowii]